MVDAHKRMVTPALLVVLAFAAGIAMWAGSTVGAQDGESLVVRAGDGEVGYAVNEFLPENITIEEGTTVEYAFPWFEPHTVTIGSPEGDPLAPIQPLGTPVEFDGSQVINSGLIFGPQEETFQITFTEAGEYDVYCVIHPFMTSVVTVVEEGAEDVELDTQESVDERGDAEYAAALADLQAIAAILAEADITITPNGDGTNTYEVITGDENENGDVQQFFPPALDIAAGDTVTFVSDNMTPHTATFNIQNAPEDLPPDPLGWPAVDEGEDGITAGEFVHSGIIGEGPFANNGTSFSVTFNEVGSFPYICVLHADQGMTGVINVQAAGEETPTVPPTEEPTEEPTPEPTEEPTEVPTEEPTEEPTEAPTATATEEPTEAPTATATSEPTVAPTQAPPTATPTRDAPAPPDSGSGGFTSNGGGPLTWMLLLGAILIAGGAGTALVRARR